jgi:hypothetical protein
MEPTDDGDDLWDSVGWPMPGELVGGELPEQDAAAILQAAEQIQLLTNQAKSQGKKVFLHLGIGVGDPTTTLSDLNNPSGDTTDMATRMFQVNPPYLWDAVEQGYYVIAVNVNYPDPDVPVVEFASPDQGVRLQVPARFPLGTANLTKQPWMSINEAAGNADRIVVMSAISQLNYDLVLRLVPVPRQALRYTYLRSCYRLAPLVLVRVTRSTACQRKSTTNPATVAELTL